MTRRWGLPDRTTRLLLQGVYQVEPVAGIYHRFDTTAVESPVVLRFRVNPTHGGANPNGRFRDIAKRDPKLQIAVDHQFFGGPETETAEADVVEFSLSKIFSVLCSVLNICA